MTHNIQPGVILVQVCGEHLLVATREARGKCPYVKQLNATGAYFWTLLAQNMTLGEMTQAAAQRYGAPPEPTDYPNSQPSYQNSRPAPAIDQPAPAYTSGDTGDFEEIPTDDDLPF